MILRRSPVLPAGLSPVVVMRESGTILRGVAEWIGTGEPALGGKSARETQQCRFESCRPDCRNERSHRQTLPVLKTEYPSLQLLWFAGRTVEDQPPGDNAIAN